MSVDAIFVRLKYAPQPVPQVQFSELGRQDHETVSRSTYGTWWMQAKGNGSKTLAWPSEGPTYLPPAAVEFATSACVVAIG